ncbi:MAG: phosphoribosyltransferase [Chloroflexi bacterium]|nr:MAG: phosphoribosyltransferase [Chloroflexota bacterium]
METGPIWLPEQVHQAPISRQSVEEMLAKSPRRICFASTHRNALRHDPGENWVGRFAVPFPNTVYPLFHADTGLELFENRRYGNWWRSIRTEEEYEKIGQWVDANRELVFLRDGLALSIALGEHMEEPGKRSEIGELEYRAKYNRDSSAIDALVARCETVIGRLPYYRDATGVCAVPPSPEKAFDLPSRLAGAVSERLGMRDLTNTIRWRSQKPSLKEVPFNEKWGTLEQVGLDCGHDVAGQRVILVDDMYQSGVTMHYVAMGLIASGAEHVYGLALAKALRDTDNE